MVEVDGVAHEGWVIDEVEAGGALWYFAPLQKPLVQLHVDARLECLGIPQEVDHVNYVVVEIAEGLTADAKSLSEKEEAVY